MWIDPDGSADGTTSALLGLRVSAANASGKFSLRFITSAKKLCLRYSSALKDLVRSFRTRVPTRAIEALGHQGGLHIRRFSSGDPRHRFAS